MAIVDYSWARPDPVGLRNAGYVAAMRYLGHTSRDLSRGELDRLHGAGLGVGVVWETTARRPLDGYDAGRADAASANRFADELGVPAKTPIFYAVDFGATDLQIRGPVTDYFDGVRSVPGRPVGCYGSYPVVEHLMGIGAAACAWQCAGWSGSGSGSGGSIRCDDGSVRRRSRHACLFQEVPESRMPGTDHNHVLAEPIDFVFWPPGMEPHTTVTEEDDMAVETHIWVTAPGSEWFAAHGGDPDGQGMFVALNTDQFVRALSPDEWEGYGRLKQWADASGAKPSIIVDGIVPDWMFSARTLLPREWPEPGAPAVVPITADQLAELSDRLGVDLARDVASELAEELAGRLQD